MTVSAFQIRNAARCLRSGGVIAYPTEAVYGLGSLPFIESAVTKVLTLKRRDPAKGLILIASSFDQLIDYIVPLDDGLMEPVLASWPGANTWILPARPWVPHWVRGQHDSLAVRVTDHPVAATLCTAVDSPLVSTSANISRRPPARSALRVRHQFGDDIDFIVPGALGQLKNPTPIRDARSGKALRI